MAEIITVIVGVIIILLLAEIIISKAIALAGHYNLSGTFIGLTVLSIGTSIPEIMSHIVGSVEIVRNPGLMNTFSGLLMGTNIGSDIFQQNFVLAVVGLIGTIVVIKKHLNLEVGALIGAVVLVWLFCLGGFLSRWEGALLVLAYVAYLVVLKRSKISVQLNHKIQLKKKELVLAIALIMVAFVLMGFVADNVLRASMVLVEVLPISASFFGVILLGIAAALPELTTSLIAVFKKRKEISAGILIGSNITNPLFGIGIGALISGYVVPNVVVWYDLPVKIATAALIYIFLMKHKDLKKSEAVMLIILFFVYLFLRQMFFPVDF